MSGALVGLKLAQDVLELASLGVGEDSEEFCVALGEQPIHTREGADRFGCEFDPVAPAVARVDPPVDQPAGFESVDCLGNRRAIDPGVVGDLLLRGGAQRLGGEQDGDHPIIEAERRDLGSGRCADRRRDAVDLRGEELLFSGFGHASRGIVPAAECQQC